MRVFLAVSFTHIQTQYMVCTSRSGVLVIFQLFIYFIRLIFRILLKCSGIANFSFPCPLFFCGIVFAFNWDAPTSVANINIFCVTTNRTERSPVKKEETRTFRAMQFKYILFAIGK